MGIPLKQKVVSELEKLSRNSSLSSSKEKDIFQRVVR